MIRGKRRPIRPMGSDLSALKEALADGRDWVKLAHVVKGDNGSHYEYITEGGETVDLLIECELIPNGERVSARYSGPGDVLIPKVGTEGVVIFPDGEIENDPVWYGSLSTGYMPSDASETVRIIETKENGEVHIRSRGGTAKRLATYEDLEAVLDFVLAHKHIGVTTGAGISGTYDPATPPAAPSITGTEVLKGE